MDTAVDREAPAARCRALRHSAAAGRFTAAALLILAAVRALDLGAALLFYGLLAVAPASPLLAPLASACAGLDTLHLLPLAAITASIAFLVWFHRATAVALHHLASPTDHSSAGLPTSPGRAVASFFIPIANLILPYLNMKALAAASHPGELPPPTTVLDNPLAGYREPARRLVTSPVAVRPAPLAAWWASWVIGSLLARFSHESPTVTTVAAAILLIGNLYTVGIVRAIDRLQAERGRRLDALPAEGLPSS